MRGAVKATPQHAIEADLPLRSSGLVVALNLWSAPRLNKLFTQAMIPASTLPMERLGKNSGHQGILRLTPHRIRSNEAPTSFAANGFVIA